MTKSQKLYEAKSQGSFKGPEELFTGDVSVELLFPPNETAHYSGAYVTFEAGARTNWHEHPAGQHMIVVSGTALTGTRDGKVIHFEEGESVWCPSDIDHWHGATPHSAMKHLVLTGDLNGKNVIWKEKVTDEQYLSGQKEVSYKVLSEKQKSIILMTVFTTKGDLKRLNSCLEEALEKGMTVNEIKEVLVHLYAYIGFPRSLNGLFSFMELLEQRKNKGIKDEMGREVSPLPRNFDKDEFGAKVRAKLSGLETIPPKAEWQKFVPEIDSFLKEHLFADIFVRDVLDYQEREMVTVASLASMEGTESQLFFHLQAFLNTGLTESHLNDLIALISDFSRKADAQKIQNVWNALKAKK